MAGFCLQKIPILLMVFNSFPFDPWTLKKQSLCKGIILEIRALFQAWGKKDRLTGETAAGKPPGLYLMPAVKYLQNPGV
jgi:hypothetical protein